MKSKVFIFLAVIVILIIATVIFMYIFTPAELNNTTTSGFKIRSQTWRGTITIKGDVYYAPWAQLTVEPGTKILFDKENNIEGTDWTKWADAYIKDHDDPTGRKGYKKSHFALYGKIIAVGTKTELVTFTSAQTKPEYADWDQLILSEGSILDYVEVAYAHNGVNVNGKNVQIRNSIIHDSLWSCVDVFSTGVTVENNEIYHCWHQAIGTKVPGEIIIKNNQVHDANLGINCEHAAKPTITNNQFAAAAINPDCGQNADNTVLERSADTQGGTYNDRLIYPAQVVGK